LAAAFWPAKPNHHVTKAATALWKRILLTFIANRNIVIAYCDIAEASKTANRSDQQDNLPVQPGSQRPRKVKLGEKIRYLREVEGSLRGLDRAMSQLEVARAIEGETGSKLSQSYLSQIESGARPHLTSKSRQILSTFFKVHPGYLVDDPEGYSPELQSAVRNVEDKLDMWLVGGAERFSRDPELKQALLTLARHEHSRECLLLLEAILETPGLAPRLSEVLRPKTQGAGNNKATKGTKEGTHK
jgi:transcriptional regulator with XRE-family HTH domain